MRLFGWCRVCRKLKRVRVTSMFPGQRNPTPIGICAECEMKQNTPPMKGAQREGER